MPLTQLYHTRDPIENLRVHVTLRKIANAASEDTTASSVGTTWDYCFQWQEKKAKKLSTAARKSKSRTADVAEDIETESSHPASARSSVLCSYIDADNYVSTKELAQSVTTAASGNASTHLASAQHRRLPHEHGLAATVPTLQKHNTERAWLRRHREETFRCMHIVASFDDSDGGGDERVLCAMRFDTDTGLLSVTPGFSVPIDFDKEDTETIARKGGPKLSTYRLAIAGALYEYTLDNVNDLIPLAAPRDQQLLRELELQDEKRDEARVAALRAREGSGAFAQTQQLYFDEMRFHGVVKRRLVLAEIVSAHDLQSASGTTVAVFNLHTQIHLELCSSTKAPASTRDNELQHDYDSDDEVPGVTTSPVLSLKVFSQDSWGRKRTEGCCEFAIPVSAGHVDRLVPIMKPVLSIREQLEELFLGADESDERIDQLRADATTLHHVNSRLGVHVQSTDASIRVRFNTVDQTAATAQASSQSMSAKNAHAPAQVRPHALPELRIVKRSVNEILQSVRLEKRLAQTPLSSVESQGGTTGLSAASAVHSVLARLNAAKTTAASSPLTGSI